MLPQNNIIKNNLVYNTGGVGINGDSAANFIVGNVAYNNEPNYGSDVAADYIFSGGITATLPNPFLNSWFSGDRYKRVIDTSSSFFSCVNFVKK